MSDMPPISAFTRDALLTALSGAARAQIRHETTVVAVAGPADEPEVTFSDGTSGRFDLVVGADGVDSAMRKVIYRHIEPAYRSFCAWRTVMTCAGRRNAKHPSGLIVPSGSVNVA